MNENANKRAKNTGHGNKPADLGTSLRIQCPKRFQKLKTLRRTFNRRQNCGHTRTILLIESV